MGSLTTARPPPFAARNFLISRAAVGQFSVSLNSRRRVRCNHAIRVVNASSCFSSFRTPGVHSAAKVRLSSIYPALFSDNCITRVSHKNLGSISLFRFVRFVRPRRTGASRGGPVLQLPPQRGPLPPLRRRSLETSIAAEKSARTSRAIETRSTGLYCFEKASRRRCADNVAASVQAPPIIVAAFQVQLVPISRTSITLSRIDLRGVDRRGRGKSGSVASQKRLEAEASGPSGSAVARFLAEWGSALVNWPFHETAGPCSV